jgi:hypothetical protein
VVLEAPRPVPTTREESGIVTTTAAGDGNRPGRQGEARQVGAENGVRPPELPAVASLIVEALPEGRVVDRRGGAHGLMASALQ